MSAPWASPDWVTRDNAEREISRWETEVERTERFVPLGTPTERLGEPVIVRCPCCWNAELEVWLFRPEGRPAVLDTVEGPCGCRRSALVDHEWYDDLVTVNALDGYRERERREEAERRTGWNTPAS